mmetsp:Transcript_32543/g.76650  ORF Transcript_32543/g.76650 Transcript_32543/m.76650 type:complete len:229 (-) Transcript_32543:1789-2475(-)
MPLIRYLHHLHPPSGPLPPRRQGEFDRPDVRPASRRDAADGHGPVLCARDHDPESLRGGDAGDRARVAAQHRLWGLDQRRLAETDLVVILLLVGDASGPRAQKLAPASARFQPPQLHSCVLPARDQEPANALLLEHGHAAHAPDVQLLALRFDRHAPSDRMHAHRPVLMPSAQHRHRPGPSSPSPVHGNDSSACVESSEPHLGPDVAVALDSELACLHQPPHALRHPA